MHKLVVVNVGGLVKVRGSSLEGDSAVEEDGEASQAQIDQDGGLYLRSIISLNFLIPDVIQGGKGYARSVSLAYRGPFRTKP